MAREADLRYQPNVKDLKDAMHFVEPDSTPQEKELGDKILGNYIRDDQ